jgi:hypothetical protein
MPAVQGIPLDNCLVPGLAIHHYNNITCPAAVSVLVVHLVEALGK